MKVLQGLARTAMVVLFTAAEIVRSDQRYKTSCFDGILCEIGFPKTGVKRGAQCDQRSAQEKGLKSALPPARRSLGWYRMVYQENTCRW